MTTMTNLGLVIVVLHQEKEEKRWYERRFSSISNRQQAGMIDKGLTFPTRISVCVFDIVGDHVKGFLVGKHWHGFRDASCVVVWMMAFLQQWEESEARVKGDNFGRRDENLVLLRLMGHLRT